MDFTNGVITEYSAPSAELVEKMATSDIDLTKIPLIQLLELPEFKELTKQKLPREFRELFDEFHKLKKFLDEE